MSGGEYKDPTAGDEHLHNSKCLNWGEVHLLIEHRLKNSKADEGQPPEIISQCKRYSQRFRKFKNDAILKTIRARLTSLGLTEFEIASLMNLVPDGAESAMEMLPSLRERLPRERVEEAVRSLSQAFTTQE
eukprot:GHVR01165208.1.p1 GENE.GHVR01165208.1~~GHVR01165208.1.p1  ORF type:complete len:131 (+),score=30.09 GHVR01165208.1:47-439(+)